jgi:hypothetical protein
MRRRSRKNNQNNSNNNNKNNKTKMADEKTKFRETNSNIIQ